MAGRLGHILLTTVCLSAAASDARAEQDPQVESAARRLLAEGGYRTEFNAGDPRPVETSSESKNPYRERSPGGGSIATGIWIVIVAAVIVTLTVALALVTERKRRRSSGAPKTAAAKAVSATSATILAQKDRPDDDDPDALEAAGFAAASIHARLRRAFAVAFAGRPPLPAFTARAAFARLPDSFAARDALRDLVFLVERSRYAGAPVEALQLTESRAALARVVAVAGARR